MKGILPLVLIAGTGYLLYKKVGDATDKLQYSITDAEIDKQNSSIRAIATKITLEITNTNKAGFTFTGLTGFLILQGKKVAKINWMQQVTIKPMATTVIEVPIMLPTGNLVAGLLKTVLNYIKDKSLPGVKIQGKILTNAGSLNVDLEKTFAVN